MSPEVFERVTAVQMDNLAVNYSRWPTTVVGRFTLNDGTPIMLVRQVRELGRQCYYAVSEIGEPLAYVAGNLQKRGSRRRHIIGSTFVAPAWRQKHLVMNMYQAIVACGDTLVSDWDRTPLMDTVWLKLQQRLPYKSVARVSDRFIAFADRPIRAAA